MVAGIVGDRAGHRAGILLSVGVQIAALALMLTTRGRWSCLGAYLLCGICMGAANISHANLLFETCPHDNRVAHITIGNIVLGMGTAVIPLLAGWLAQQWGVRATFGACLVFSLAAFVWFVVRVREPRLAA